MTRAALTRRLEALTAIVRPRHSLAAKVARLTPDMAARYAAWRAAERAGIANLEAEHGPGGAFAAYVDGKADHPLPPVLVTALGLAVPVITADMSSDQAAETYHRYRTFER